MADAVDRRRLLLLTQTGLACTNLALMGLDLLPDASIAGFYAVAFVAAGLGAVDQPARSSAIPRLVPRERLTGAIALGQLGFRAVAVAGPAFGGLLLATVGVAAAFAVDALSFAAAIGALRLMARSRPGPVRPGRGSARSRRDCVSPGPGGSSSGRSSSTSTR